jgi:tetratricopeptide (TPR) repeat protein
MEGNDALRARGRRLKLLGDCYGDLGRNAVARQYYDQAEALFKTYLKPGDDVFVSIESGRAHLLRKEGRYEEAVPVLREVVAGYGRGDQPGIESPWTLAIQMELAETLLAAGHTEEAIALVKPRIEAASKLPPNHPAHESLRRLLPKLKLRT